MGVSCPEAEVLNHGINKYFFQFVPCRYEKTEKKKSRHKWQLFFRIFCFIDPNKVKEESVEGQFLYEQVGP